MSALAVIPARGGSKGVWRKNLRTVHGKTLIARCVETCLSAEQVERVIVSTDDEEIAEEVERHGGEVFWRSLALSGDEVLSDPVLLEVCLGVAHLPDTLVFAQCTAPLMTPADIDATVSQLRWSRSDLCMAVAESHGWHVTLDRGRAVGVGFDISRMVRRQDRRMQYEIAGSVWAMDTEKFLRRGRVYCDNVSVHVVGRKLDIDTEADLALAEKLMECRESENWKSYIGME